MGPSEFIFHRSILADASWNLKKGVEISTKNRSMCSWASSELSPILPLYRRECELLKKIIFVKNNQHRTAKHWKLTLQVNKQLSSLQLYPFVDLITSISESPSHSNSSFSTSFWISIQFKWFSLAKTCIYTMELMEQSYSFYQGLLELAHFMPIVLSISAIYSRLYLLCSKILSVSSAFYNDMEKNQLIGSDKLIEKWQTWFDLPASIDFNPSPFQWSSNIPQLEDTQSSMSSLHMTSNRGAGNVEDLGEELDESELEQFNAKKDVSKAPDIRHESKSSSVISSSHTMMSEVKQHTGGQKVEKQKMKSMSSSSTPDRHQHSPQSKQNAFKHISHPFLDQNDKKMDHPAPAPSTKITSIKKKSDDKKDQHMKKKKRTNSATIDDIFGSLLPKQKKHKHEE